MPETLCTDCAKKLDEDSTRYDRRGDGPLCPLCWEAIEEEFDRLEED